MDQVRLPAPAALAFAALLAACDATAPVDVDPPPGTLRTSAGVRVDGMTRVLVIPARFADGLPPQFTPADLQRRLFGSGTGGVASLGFRLASSGKFALRGDVAPWVQTTVTLASAGQPGVFAPTRFGDYLVEAIQGADPHVDYGRYDSDGPDGIANSGDDDGFMDGGIIVLGSERDLGCFNGTGRGPHPHVVRSPNPMSKANEPVPTQDASANGGVIRIRAYTAMSASNCAGTGTNHTALTHELGHLLLGLPDLYHVAAPVSSGAMWEARRWIVGCWELMASGSGWGCGTGAPVAGREPSALGAWSRVTVGWVIPTVVPTDVQETYELSSMAGGGDVLKIEIGPGEYVLVEYRQPTGGDLGVPGNGLLLYHVTESLPLRPATPEDPRRYQVMLIEADDDGELVRIESEGGNRGEASDAFGSGASFGADTHAAAHSTAGVAFPFRIDQISIDVARGIATFRVSPFIPPAQ